MPFDDFESLPGIDFPCVELLDARATISNQWFRFRSQKRFYLPGLTEVLNRTPVTVTQITVCCREIADKAEEQFSRKPVDDLSLGHRLSFPKVAIAAAGTNLALSRIDREPMIGRGSVVASIFKIPRLKSFLGTYCDRGTTDIENAIARLESESGVAPAVLRMMSFGLSSDANDFQMPLAPEVGATGGRVVARTALAVAGALIRVPQFDCSQMRPDDLITIESSDAKSLSIQEENVSAEPVPDNPFAWPSSENV